MDDHCCKQGNSAVGEVTQDGHFPTTGEYEVDDTNRYVHT